MAEDDVNTDLGQAGDSVEDFEDFEGQEGWEHVGVPLGRYNLLIWCAAGGFY